MHFHLFFSLALLLSAAVALHQVNCEGTKGKSAAADATVHLRAKQLDTITGATWKANISSARTLLSRQHRSRKDQSSSDSTGTARKDPEMFQGRGLWTMALVQGKEAFERAVNLDLDRVLPSISSKSRRSASSFQKRTIPGVNEENPHYENFLVRWIASLFHVEGESLAEFLRIYRVHVLYDMCFYIVKWLFFAYVGLLIP